MRVAPWLAALLVPAVLAACGGRDLSPTPDTARTDVGRAPDVRNQNLDSVFGDEGVSFGNNGTLNTLITGEEESPGGIPVNRYLWQASLDTLRFLPLASTDPFTGVIATDWGASADAPGERFKVTAYMVDSDLAASALKVAVYRERLDDNSVWVPASVDPATPRRIEDAILTRARQIRLAEVEGSNAG